MHQIELYGRNTKHNIPSAINLIAVTIKNALFFCKIYDTITAIMMIKGLLPQ